jgi:Swt1-like HEPN
MIPEDALEALKRFVMTNQLIEHNLDLVEEEYGIDLERGYQGTADPDEAYYPQIEMSIRAEAARMAPHYEMFYSLEKTIRSLISSTLEAEEGSSWWNGTRVPPRIKTDVEARRQREIDTGMTPRSDEQLDFTTFGELSEIIKHNWDLFGGMFSSVRAVERVMANLNSLRGPIAHCSPLAEDEVVRLRLTVRDWFRLME